MVERTFMAEQKPLVDEQAAGRDAETARQNGHNGFNGHSQQNGHSDGAVAGARPLSPVDSDHVKINGLDHPTVSESSAFSSKRSVSFHADVAASDGPKAAKDHTAVSVEERSRTMSGYSRTAVEEMITLKFMDVHYQVTITAPSKSFNPLEGLLPSKKQKEEKKKEILHGISGSVLPGEVLAMLGPSGGGKTSFLNVLGGRVKPSGVTGSLTYNDMPYSKALKRKIGFVTQDDTFFPHLTVRETLMYAAILRLPKELTQAQKIARADEIIAELGLEKCKDTIIGGPFLRGISGGERKRCSIGHEILTNPSLLFLDEPTSGLDSTTALRIVQVLQNLAESGRTVVTTIHQPSSRLFHSFHKLLLLSEGNSIFFGHASDAMPYFHGLGFSPLFATNPADFLLDLANGTTADISVPGRFEEDKEWQEKGAVEKQVDVKKFFADAHRERQLAGINRDVLSLPAVSENEKKLISEKRGWTASWGTQFAVLWTRGLKERRHEYLSPLRFYQVIALSTICGLLWWQSDTATNSAIQDQSGFIFFVSIFWGFFPLFTAIFTFPQERAVLSKERASDMYRLSSYFLSRTLSDLPMELLLPTIFVAISYFMAGLKATAGAFLGTLFSVYLIVTATQGCGFFLGAAVMDVKKATTYASVLLLTFMLAGGYYLQYIPPFISWIKYVSFTFYAYRLLVKIQYSPSQTYGCGPQGEVQSIQCPIQSASALTKIPLEEAWVDVLGLLAQVIIYRVFAYIGLRRMRTGV